MNTVNINHIILKIYDFEASPNEISNLLNIKPSAIYNKGDTYSIGPKYRPIEKIRDSNYWEFRITKESNIWIQDLIEDFFKSYLNPNIEVLRKISVTSKVEIAITLNFKDGWNPGFHFKSDTLKTIYEIGAELDIDIYCINEKTSKMTF